MNKGPISEKVVAAVKKLVDKGLSAHDIGVETGMSRSAVCGLCFRRGWHLKGRPGRVQPQRDPKVVRTAAPRKRSRKSKGVKEQPVTTAPAVFVSRKQVRPNTIPRCMWRDCAAPAAAFNKPFCSEHLATRGAAW